MPAPDEDSPAVRQWVDKIRPTFSHDSEPYGPFEPPDEKVERLRRTIWNEPLIIGRGLAKKIPGWTERLEKQTR
jgi:hypothetical protein